MPTAGRLIYDGAICHIIQRGNNRQKIFREEDDYQKFLSIASDYKAKYSDPDTRYLVPAPISEAEAGLAQYIGKKSHAALGCKSVSRTDMILDPSGKIFVLEVNTIPGFTGHSLLPMAAAKIGIGFAQLAERIVAMAMQR